MKRLALIICAATLAAVAACRAHPVGAIDNPVGYAWEASVCGPGPCYVDAGFTGNTQGAGGWTTRLDCNFATQPLQLLNDAGPWTICGDPFTVINGANTTQAIAVDGGLVIYPNSTAVGGPPDLSAGVTLPLLTIYSGATNGTGWRIRWYENDNVSNNYSFCHLYVADLTNQSGADPTGILMGHAYNSGLEWITQIANHGGYTSTYAQTTYTAHVAQLLLTEGYFLTDYSLWGQIDGGSTWSNTTAYPMTSSYQDLAQAYTTAGPIANWGIAITAAQNSGGAMYCNTGRLVVETLN